MDNEQQLIKIVPDNGAISILQTQELPEDSNLLKDVLSVHLKNDERLFDAQYMAIKSYDGNRNSFDMYRIVNELVPDNATEFEGVQVAPYELEGVVVEDIRPQGWTIERTTNQILKDSDWRLGYVDDNLPTVTTNFYYLSAKDSLKKLQELTGVEFTFKVEISGNKITDKWVEVYRELGNRTLKRFNYGTNALTVKRETSHSELYTALIGRGKGEEVGETDAGDATYGRKINFSDVEWKKSAGKPVDKPKGQKYIELPQATAEYGIKLLDGRKVPRIGMVEFSDTEEPEVLIEQTWQALQEYARPKVLFSATVANIGDTGIGDTVTIHRHDLNMHYKTRVRKVMRNRKNNDKTQVEIGDVVYTASTKRQSNINSKLNNMENELSNVRAEVSHVVVSADGKNTINYGNLEPERKRVGDSWVRDHPSLAGETQWLVWNGEAWELILDTSETTLNKEAIEQAQQDIAAERQRIDVVVDDMNTAVSDAGYLDLSGALTGIQQISQTAQSNAENALTHSLNAISDASTALSNSTDALSQVANIDVRVDDVEGTLELKADKQEVDTLSGIVDTHTLDIQANAQGLALKANQDTVDTLAGTVQSLGTEFDIVAGQVNSRVWNTDIETAIDGIEVGGRNLLPTAFNLYSTEGTYGYIRILDEDEKIILKLYEEDDSVDMSGIYFGFTRNGHSSGDGVKWAMSGGSLSSNLNDNLEMVGNNYQFFSYFPNNRETFDKIFSRFKIKIERGTIATDWTPAPEDTLARFDHIETEWSQTFDTFSQTVSSIDGRVSKQEQTVSGMESVVYDPETGLSSLNTQLANLIQVAVTGEEMTGAISVLENNINARVEKGDVINQINISDENILIQANKIMALGDVVVDGKLTITDEFIAPNAQIDGAKIADATIGSAKIASLDVNKLSGNSTEFVQSAWNNAVGGNVSISGSGIVTTSSNGAQGLIQNGVFLARNPSGSTVGYIGYDQVGSSPAMTVTTSLGSHFKVRQHMGGNVYKDVFQLNANDGAAIFTPKSIFMGTHELDAQDRHRFNIIGNESVGIGGNNRTVLAVSASSGVGYATFFANLNMNGYYINNAAGYNLRSERKYKSNILPLEHAMETVEQLKIYSYDKMGEDGQQVPELGIIVDEAPECVLGLDGKTVDMYSYISLIGKSQQELIAMVKEMREEITELKGMVA